VAQAPAAAPSAPAAPGGQPSPAPGESAPIQGPSAAQQQARQVVWRPPRPYRPPAAS
jgi:hypothetical protein